MYKNLLSKLLKKRLPYLSRKCTCYDLSSEETHQDKKGVQRKILWFDFLRYIGHFSYINDI